MEPRDVGNAGLRAHELAHELRASLTARLDVETLLAEASAARQAAVVDADALVAQAQLVSDQLVQDSRDEAERLRVAARVEADDTLRQARASAEAVRRRAETDVEEHRRRVRAEVTEQVAREVAEQARAELTRLRTESEDLLDDVEASVRILAVSLDAARTHVDDMLARLDGHGADAGSEAADPAQPADGEHDGEYDDEPASGPDPEASAPRTATEAYLRSAHLDHGDPPLPPLDDAEVAARYGRDAQRGIRGSWEPPAEDRTDERPGSSVGDEPAGRPLGWLFRSPS